MSSEADLQRAIDRDPLDTGARQLLADYLLEAGAPRGPGYFALWRLGKTPRLDSRELPGYHDGTGTVEYPLSMIGHDIKTDPWVSGRWKEYIAGTERQRDRQRRMSRGNWVVDLAADPKHALPRLWFEACWGKFWEVREERYPWVVSDDRQRLDDMVAEAFATMPKAYREYVLTAPEPILPFSFRCFRCAGNGILKVAMNPEKKTLQEYLEDTTITPEKLARLTWRSDFETPCDVCNGRKWFWERIGP
jgi:hypothetical protein